MTTRQLHDDFPSTAYDLAVEVDALSRAVDHVIAERRQLLHAHARIAAAAREVCVAFAEGRLDGLLITRLAAMVE